jgi:hypothetical protein
MKTILIKIGTYVIFLLLVLTIFCSLIISTSAEPEPYERGIIQKISAKLLGMIWYNIGAGPYAKYFYANPSVVEIDYLDNVSTELIWGTERLERRNYHRFQPQVFPEFTLIYEAIFPPEVPEGAFRVIFDPPTFDVRDYHDFWDPQVTSGEIPVESVAQASINMTLFLDIPADPENTFQDFILKINVSIYRKYGQLLAPLFMGGFGRFAFFGGFWRISNVADIGHKSFDLFVKVAPYREAEIISISPPIEMQPNDLKNAKIQVQNRGSHIEQFGFKVSGAGDTLYVNTPSPITLSPGEIRTLDIGLITKPLAYDRGTLHTVSVDMYPTDTPNITIATGDLTVRTKGFALQSIFRFRFSWHIFFAISIILFLIILIAIIRRVQLLRYLKKPRKPWTLKEEKQYLQKLLKDKEKEEYQKNLEMMKSEHISALLWYKFYKKSVLREKRKKGKLFSIINNTFSSIKKVSKKPSLPKKTQIIKNKSKKTTTIKIPKIKTKEIIKKPEPKPLSKQDEVIRKIQLQQRKTQNRF